MYGRVGGQISRMDLSRHPEHRVCPETASDGCSTQVAWARPRLRATQVARDPGCRPDPAPTRPRLPDPGCATRPRLPEPEPRAAGPSAQACLYVLMMDAVPSRP